MKRVESDSCFSLVNVRARLSLRADWLQISSVCQHPTSTASAAAAHLKHTKNRSSISKRRSDGRKRSGGRESGEKERKELMGKPLFFLLSSFFLLTAWRPGSNKHISQAGVLFHLFGFMKKHTNSCKAVSHPAITLWPLRKPPHTWTQWTEHSSGVASEINWIPLPLEL